MFSYVSLEERVPQDHPLRAIRKSDEVLRAMAKDFDGMYGRDYDVAFKLYYEPCFIHFVLESNGGAPVFPPYTLLAKRHTSYGFGRTIRQGVFPPPESMPMHTVRQ